MIIYEDDFASLKCIDFDIDRDWHSLETISSMNIPRTEEWNRNYGESIKKARKASSAYAKYDANRPKTHGCNIGKSLQSLAKRPIVEKIKQLNGKTRNRKLTLSRGWYQLSESELLPILHHLQSLSGLSQDHNTEVQP